MPEPGSALLPALGLAVAGILLLVFACGAWSQTVYSSPLRVTNTPLPVAAGETAPLYVTPAGGRMAVQVVNSAVNVTAASPLPVTMSGTLPVAQQGTVTVAPSGGQMPVTGTVALSGTPQVALSGTGNTVNLGGTFIVRSWDYNFPGAYTVSIPMGNFVNAVEADMVTFHCYSNAGAKVTKAIIWMDSHAGDQPRFPFVTIAETVGDATTTWWSAALPGKLYIPAGADLHFYLDFREPATGQCFVGLSGRMH
ncbi:MAG: hypothetical protein ABSH05_01445 [Bryobacteraceae bacterium]